LEVIKEKGVKLLQENEISHKVLDKYLF